MLSLRVPDRWRRPVKNSVGVSVRERIPKTHGKSSVGMKMRKADRG
jgi:hypothetical protein